MSLVALAHHAARPFAHRRAMRDALAIVAVTAIAAGFAYQCDLLSLQRSVAGGRTITSEEALVLANLFTAGLVAFCLRRFLDERRALVRSLAGGVSARPTAREFTDVATGISNRRHLELECRETLAAGGDATLLVVHVGGADEIESELGRDEADRVVAILARRLRAAIDTSDVVAHLEGHAFAILAKSGADAEVARNVGAILVRSIEEPVLVDRRAYHLRAAIGATLVTPVDKDGEALSRADVAVTRSQGKRRSAISFFDPRLQTAA